MQPTNPVILVSPLTSPEENDLTLQELNRLVNENGPLPPGPTIQQARTAQYRWLTVGCTACYHTAEVALESIRRPPATPITDLLPHLLCTRCGKKGTPTATILGVAKNPDNCLPPVRLKDSQE